MKQNNNEEKEVEEWLKESKKKLKKQFGDFAIGLDDVKVKD